MVLGEVGVGALRAVEAVGFGVGARGGRVRRWVGDLGGFAVRARVDAVEEVEDEGRGCGEDYVAMEGEGGGLVAVCGCGWMDHFGRAV